jgi:putative transposase
MARHPRVLLPGVALHVVQRGNNRNACFAADADFLTYLGHLGHLSRKYECAVHAYCLMTNHVHLLLTADDASACGLLMRDLGRSYVPYFNRRYGRTGTLWEGRFRSCMAESARYVLACYRYIELNPVRADMVSVPSAYRWSSHLGNIGERVDPLLKPHPEYLALAEDSGGRRTAYRGLFDEVLETSLLRSIREATTGGYPLVSDAFKLEIIRQGYRTERGKPGPRAEAPRAHYGCEAAPEAVAH